MATQETFRIAQNEAIDKWEEMNYQIREIKCWIHRACGFCKLQQYDGQLCNKCPAIEICSGDDYSAAQEHIRKAEQAIDDVIIAIRKLKYEEVG